MDSPRPLLTQVRARHFKSLGHLDLDLGPLTVLVGPNGSGKSNVVAVLRFLRDASTRGLRHAYGEQGGSTTIPQRGHDRVDVGISYGDSFGEASYNLVLTSDAGKMGMVSESLSLDGRGSYWFQILSNGQIEGNTEFAIPIRSGEVVLIGEQPISPRYAGTEEAWLATELASRLSYWVSALSIYNPEPSNLRGVRRETYASPFEEDGRNLAATLAAIRETPDGETIDRVLERLVDGATGYRVEHTAGLMLPRIGYAAAGDGQPTQSDLGLESDGTIRMMAMLAALYQTPPRSLIVLEEPEAGLHPGALGVLADVIVEASTRCQVVVTTHSPDLIDCFDPGVLRVIEKVDGETRVGPVESVQRDAVRRKLFSPGELMRIEGLRREADA